MEPKVVSIAGINTRSLTRYASDQASLNGNDKACAKSV